MSAIGTKRTCRVALHMSAFGVKADMLFASLGALGLLGWGRRSGLQISALGNDCTSGTL